MKLSKSGLILVIIVPVLIIAISLAVFFFYRSMNEQSAADTELLHKFGFAMSDNDPYSESKGMLGANQIPPTFPGEKLSPVEKVIRGLMEDKDRLINENQRLEDRIESLQAHVDQLEDYKRINEHFAPDTLNQELNHVRQQLKSDISRMSEFSNFSSLRLTIATEAGVNEYRRYIEQNRLILADEDRGRIVDEYLPTYAFCVAKAVDIAANSRAEENKIYSWMRDPKAYTLQSPLKDDVETLLPPCQLELRQKLSKLRPTPKLPDSAQPAG